MKKVFWTMAVLGVMVAPAAADVVEGDEVLMRFLDVGPADGTTTNVYDGDTWNGVELGVVVTGSDLILKDGTDESVTVTVTTNTTGFKNNGATGQQDNLAWITASVPSNNFLFVEDNLTFAFYVGGLSNSLTYNVYFTATGNNNAYDGQDVSLNTVIGTNGTDFSPYDAGQGTAPYEVTWSGVSLDSNDRLSFSVVGNEFDRPSISHLRIEVVPEPATLGLLAFGGMGLLLKRRKRIA